MAAEPTDPSLGVPPTQGTWSAGAEPGSHFDDVTGDDGSKSYLQGIYAVSVLALLVSLCGLAGNVAVLWLIQWCKKKIPFSGYMLRRACTDITILLFSSIRSARYLLHLDTAVLDNVLAGFWGYFYLVWLFWLLSDSTRRCVSALWSNWYLRHCARLACVFKAFFLGLLFAYFSWDRFYITYRPQWDGAELIYDLFAVATTLLLCVSGLTLLVRVQHGPRRARLTQDALTVLLYTLGYLALGLPLSVCNIVFEASSYSVYSQELVPIFSLLRLLNSVLNPIIYFLVRRYGPWLDRAPQQEVLQRALRDEEEGAEQRGTSDPRETDATL